MPLHPMVVHFPVVLAFIVPVVIIIAWIAMTKKNAPLKGVWIGILVLQLVLSGFSFVAMELGEGDEEVVERVVPEQALEYHEELAETFAWSTLAVLATLAGLLFRNIFPLRALALAISAVSLFLVVLTGRAGGELVYKYHSAQVFATGASGSLEYPSTLHSPAGKGDGDLDDD